MSAQLAGALRHAHSRLAEFAEEIAFMGGEKTEKMLVERDYATVVLHERKVLRRRWWFGCAEEGLVKWTWGAFGVSCPSMPESQSFEPRDSWSFVRSQCSSSFQEWRMSIWADGRKDS